MRRASYYSQVLGTLQALHRAYPNYNIGKHLSTALDGYGDMWGITDREMLFALEKYKAQLEMDIPHADDDEIDQIIKEGMNLDDILKDQDGEDY
jgi:hypothetical protein